MIIHDILYIRRAEKSVVSNYVLLPLYSRQHASFVQAAQKSQAGITLQHITRYIQRRLMKREKENDFLSVREKRKKRRAFLSHDQKKKREKNNQRFEKLPSPSCIITQPNQPSPYTITLNSSSSRTTKYARAKIHFKPPLHDTHH